MARLHDTSTITRLPGVGERLDVEDVDGRAVLVVRHRDGHVEIHATGGWPVELDPATATSVGAFLSGRFALDPRTAQRLERVAGGLAFDWVRLDGHDRAVGHTIAELAVRQRTGVTIVAVLRGSQPIVAPDPETRLQAGDELVFACRGVDRDGFARFLEVGS
ncbi:MAG: hypothetical protein MUF83_19575 [Acidimicrobiales bacterium]|nr:hypothetical protein [Acidimicrobiales bacterium]